MTFKVQPFEVTWAMPNKHTFQIVPIANFISKQIVIQKVESEHRLSICDPFCGTSLIADVRNDIRQSRIDSLSWLLQFPDHIFDIVLFDPPYTPRQLKECYDDIGMALHDTKSSYWANLKDEIARVTSFDGCVLSFGYGGSNLGMKRGLHIYEGLVVLHGGNHNATICMAEQWGAP